MNFSEEELRNLLVFLNRVQLSGQEADVLVMLKLKIRTMLDKPKEETPSHDGAKEPVPTP